MSAPTTEVSSPQGRVRASRTTKRAVLVTAGVVAVVAMALGTEVVAEDDPRILGVEEFSADSFGAEQFEIVQDGVADRAVEAVTLSGAIADDADGAADEYAVPSSGGPVFSVSFTGVVGEGQSGIYEVAVDGLPEDLLIRVQTGPAINGTALRDATGEYDFGQFTNQIAYQDAASALNDQLKAQVLEDLDTENLTGETISVVGAFTLVNPEGWLVTPAEVEVL